MRIIILKRAPERTSLIWVRTFALLLSVEYYLNLKMITNLVNSVFGLPIKILKTTKFASINRLFSNIFSSCVKVAGIKNHWKSLQNFYLWVIKNFPYERRLLCSGLRRVCNTTWVPDLQSLISLNKRLDQFMDFCIQ